MKVSKNSGSKTARDSASTPRVEKMSSEQEKAATVASLKAFFKPRSIAVIGASKRKNSIGNRLFLKILHQEFKGVVYPVNPNAKVVGAVQAYPSVLDILGEVDLGIVIVPAESVSHVVEQCGQKGVRCVVVISAGFGESGEGGLKKQEELLETVRNYGMRLIGPNCMGIINTDPEVNMNATFSAVFPPAGHVAMGSQSGALGVAILDYARKLNLGLSTFVSIGNRADVSSNDLLEYWQEDPATDVILLYLESFGNPRKFARIARNITPTKPVVAVKSGRTAVGSRAAASHTGALATSDAASEALFVQTGIIRVNTLEELFDMANLLSHQPIPSGRRVAILTNGGGPGTLTADACAARGLELPTLSDRTLAGLKSFLPSRASLANPVDIIAEATAEDYRRALQLLAEDEKVDVVIVIFIPPIATQIEEVAHAIREQAPGFRRRGKTLVASFMGSRSASAELVSEDGWCVPSFDFPEATAIAIAKACEYNDWVRKPKGTIPELRGIDKKKARQIVKSALKTRISRSSWLDNTSVIELLNCYGILTAQYKLAMTAAEAAMAAEEIGFPVAVKLIASTMAHKTEVGGVVLDLRSQREVEEAFMQIRSRLDAMGKVDEMQGVIVQQMISEGVEVIVGVSQHPSFGSLIMFGMGGIYTELFKDITFRIHPLTDIDATEMVHSVKAYQLLGGWRGAKPSDIKSLEELLLRVSAMVEDLPQIEELDLNPVKVLEAGKGYVVVDARVILS